MIVDRPLGSYPCRPRRPCPIRLRSVSALREVACTSSNPAPEAHNQSQSEADLARFRQRRAITTNVVESVVIANA